MDGALGFSSPFQSDGSQTGGSQSGTMRPSGSSTEGSGSGAAQIGGASQVGGSLPVDVRRVFQWLDELDQFSEEGPGITRLAYTETERQAKAWWADQARAAGLDVQFDGMGNGIAWWWPEGVSGPPVLVGSHIDSVPQGGRYDGALGVLIGLETVRAVVEQSRSQGLTVRRPVGALCFSCEESSRFKVGCVGSQAMAGKLTAAQLEQLVDENGITLRQAVRSQGLSADLKSTQRQPGWFKLFVEVHVEQGRLLHEAGLPLGIVSHIAAPIREWIRIVGEAGHSGASSMQGRKDALAGAAEIVLAVERIALEMEAEGIVATAGALKAHPGAINVVAGRVDLGVDIRGLSRASIDRCRERVKDECTRIASRRGLSVEFDRVWDGEPAELPQEIQSRFQSACEKRGYGFRSLVSWSGHDSIYMATQGPVGLLFVRNPSGASHRPDEAVDEEAVAAALHVVADLISEEVF